jgi:MFS family permease
MMSASDPATPDEDRIPWRAAAAAFASVLIGLGLARFAYTPMIPALVQGGWYDGAAAASLGAVNLGGYLAGALAAAPLARRVPVAMLIRIAIALTVISFAASAVHLGYGWLAVWRAIGGITGAILMIVAVPAALSATPIRRRGRVAGLVFTGVGLGVVVSGQLVPIAAGFGVVEAWAMLTVFALVLGVVGWNGWPREAAGPAVGGGHLGVPPAATGAALALVGLAYALDAFGFVPHTLFWADYVARTLGLGLAAAGASWSLFGLGAAFGPITVGLVAERIGFGRTLVGGLVIKGAAIGLAAFTTAPWALAASAAVVGLLTPGMGTMVAGRITEIASPHRQRQAWAAMTVSFAVAQSLSGFAMTEWYAVFGEHRPLFIAGAGALFLGAIAAALTLRRR